MSSFGLVPFDNVREMLDACAAGHELILKKHRYWVRFGGRTYRGLPKGGHGKNEVKLGTVRQMVRYLGIDEECAGLHL
jgi:hypothetical protein